VGASRLVTRQGSMIGRVAAIAALIVAIVGVSLIVFGSGSS
jgi:hypothetical protein